MHPERHCELAKQSPCLTFERGLPQLMKNRLRNDETFCLIDICKDTKLFSRFNHIDT